MRIDGVKMKKIVKEIRTSERATIFPVGSSCTHFALSSVILMITTKTNMERQSGETTVF